MYPNLIEDPGSLAFVGFKNPDYLLRIVRTMPLQDSLSADVFIGSSNNTRNIRGTHQQRLNCALDHDYVRNVMKYWLKTMICEL